MSAFKSLSEKLAQRNFKHQRITNGSSIKNVQHSQRELNLQPIYTLKKLAEFCLNHSATEGPLKKFFNNFAY